MTLSPFLRRTLVALRKQPCSPANLSSLVFKEKKYQTAIGKGAAPGTGLVRPMLSLLAKLRKRGLVEWFSHNHEPVEWRLTMDGEVAVDQMGKR